MSLFGETWIRWEKNPKLRESLEPTLKQISEIEGTFDIEIVLKARDHFGPKYHKFFDNLIYELIEYAHGRGKELRDEKWVEADRRARQLAVLNWTRTLSENGVLP